MIEYLERHPIVAKMYADLVGFLEHWIPELVRTNRSYLTIAIGCTGGQHRSVYLVERLAQHFGALRASSRTSSGCSAGRPADGAPVPVCVVRCPQEGGAGRGRLQFRQRTASHSCAQRTTDNEGSVVHCAPPRGDDR